MDDPRGHIRPLYPYSMKDIFMRSWLFEIGTFSTIFGLNSEGMKLLPKYRISPSKLLSCYMSCQENRDSLYSVTYHSVLLTAESAFFFRSFPQSAQWKHRGNIYKLGNYPCVITGQGLCNHYDLYLCCIGSVCFVFVVLLCRDWLSVSIPVYILLLISLFSYRDLSIGIIFNLFLYHSLWGSLREKLAKEMLMP